MVVLGGGGGHKRITPVTPTHPEQDNGTLLLGHGCILDQLDSYMLTASPPTPESITGARMRKEGSLFHFKIYMCKTCDGL